jgi:hypothetical protein
MRLTAADYRALNKKKPRSKFTAIPTVVDGLRFASKSEARRYGVLKMRERAGEISHLGCHPKLPIVINGIKVCDVVADFRYFENGQRVYEDWKGYAGDTAISRLKRTLACASYPGIDWRIVKK